MTIENAALRVASTTRRLTILSVLTVVGVIFIVLATSGVLQYSFRAPLEWLGIFCLTSQLAYLCSPPIAVSLAFVAFLLGTFMDPIFIGGQSFQTWIFANLLVFVFALAGACTNALAMRFASIRKSIFYLISESSGRLAEFRETYRLFSASSKQRIETPRMMWAKTTKTAPAI